MSLKSDPLLPSSFFPALQPWAWAGVSGASVPSWKCSVWGFRSHSRFGFVVLRVEGHPAAAAEGAHHTWAVLKGTCSTIAL